MALDWNSDDEKNKETRTTFYGFNSRNLITIGYGAYVYEYGLIMTKQSCCFSPPSVHSAANVANGGAYYKQKADPVSFNVRITVHK